MTGHGSLRIGHPIAHSVLLDGARLVFERFLARVVAVVGEAATLKGGLALELRLERARTTKDVDLRMAGSPEQLLAKLQQAYQRADAG